MSEYQYFEFRALDRPLTAQEQRRLREYSSRAKITSSSFAVDYSWGDFKGDTTEWMAKYFDAFLYLANWGSHELRLRLPPDALALETAKRYCRGRSAAARIKGGQLHLEFRAEDEDGGGWVDDEEGSASLASLLPVRAELASGDLRALYLAWLGCVQADELGDDEREPPCPLGLGKLSPALEALADFLRIEPDLIAVAADGSAAPATNEAAALEGWVKALPEAEKTALLVRLARGSESGLRTELVRRFRESQVPAAPAPAKSGRTVGEMLEAWRAREEERRRKEDQREARAQERREREEAKLREKRLELLARREGQAWEEVDALLATRLPSKHDEAVALLRDLREVCASAGRGEEAEARIGRLRQRCAKRPALVERLRKAGLVA